MCAPSHFLPPLFFRFCPFPFPLLSVMRKSISGKCLGDEKQKTGGWGHSLSLVKCPVLLELRDEEFTGCCGCRILRDILCQIGHLSDHMISGLDIITGTSRQHIAVGMILVTVINQSHISDILLR